MRTSSGTRQKMSALAVEVRIPSEGRAFGALAGRLTLDGVFVSTFHSVREGSEVIVEIALPGGSVRAEGTVTRMAVAGGAGFSVVFDELAAADRARIQVAIGGGAQLSA